MNTAKLSTAALAAAALVQAPAAMAQQCLTAGEVSSLAIYVVPHAIKGVQSGCGTELGSGSWLATDGAGMSARYAALGSEAWPGAKRALLLFASSATGAEQSQAEPDITALLAGLPDESLRPLVDAIILQKVAESVKPDSCRSVDRVLEVLSRFEPQDAAELLGVLLSLVDLKDPQICPLEDS